MGEFKEYDNYDAIGLADLVRRRRISAGELLDTAITRTARINPKFNAVVGEAHDLARAAIAQGLPEGPFTGVPFLLKDLGCEAIGYPTNAGSRFFANTSWSYDSEIWIRLRQAGLVAFGRTTSPELGIGPTTEARVYGGPTRNPWNLDHTSGGSSGGAASAVAAGIVPLAHGSDGGGSVRIPASSCGLVGLKPTRARLPDGPGAGEGWGGMAIDGVLSRSVRDTAVMLDACHGADLGAPYYAPHVPRPFADEIESPPNRLRIAVCRTMLHGPAIDAECAQAVDDAARLCADLGHEVSEAKPSFDFEGAVLAWTKVVACGTALSVRMRATALGRVAGPDDLEPTIHAAVEYGESISGPDYLKSINTAHATGRQLARFFENYDVLLTATLAEPPARIGRFAMVSTDFVDYRLGPQGIVQYSPFTAIFNITGQPAISLPLHWSRAGLPVGVHFAAAFGDDAMLLKLSAQLEQARPWMNRRPALAAAQ